MNKLIRMGAKLAPLALLAALMLPAGSLWAQDDVAPAADAVSSVAAEAVVEPAAEAAAPVEAAAAPAEEEAAPVAATFEKGDIAWMLTATLLVIFMVLPGLALFYGGMVRAKNILSLSMQVFVTFCLIAVLWSIYGYSLAFTQGSTAFFGGFDRLFLKDMLDAAGNLLPAATFSKGIYIPEYMYAAFQMTFAALTPCLIVGAFAERMKFSAVLIFAVIWFTFAYLPVAHMVWFWAGPDAYTTADAAAAATAGAGYIFQLGALDFAGGTVVHINAGIAGLVGCILIGKRKGFGNSSLAPHNVPFTMVGAAILWVGWFGFNVGSNLEANAFAAQVFINTFLATAAAVLAWTFGEWVIRGKPTMLGAASGAIAGLVAITPACGWVGPMGALVIGIAGGFICMVAVIKLKAWLGYDDSLDVFGVHCVGGIVGAILTGVFNSPDLGGTGVYDYVAGTWGFAGIGAQTWIQTKGVLITILWSGVVSFIAFKLIDIVIGLRVTEEVETEGLDTAEHGERGYHM
ncbi:MAG: ammonium transporter [Cellvibrio sp.]|uniref:ammonium transporter n=1 Tax=Cellvibrio sp. TaxID=1965322 RepID=UPI0031B2C37F